MRRSIAFRSNHPFDPWLGWRRGVTFGSMDAYPFFYRHAFLPFWEGVVRRRLTIRRWQSFERTQWSSPEQLGQIQLTKLRALLEHAQTHIPYYRRLFASVGLTPQDVRSVADLSILPRLTKTIVREHYADLLDRRTAATHVHKKTSGSSGVPFRFEYDVESEVWRQANRWRGYGMAGYRPGARAVYYWGSPLPLHGFRELKTKIDRNCRREKFIDCFRQDDEALEATTSMIRRYRPQFIVGFTMATAVLARHILDHPPKLPTPITVLCAAEALEARDRRDIEAAFGGPVFETYGARETMLIACECEKHDGLHTMDEAHIVEVVTDHGPADAGQIGDILITDLHNQGMPLIRFENGDVAVASPPARCGCGRGLGRIQRVIGRQCDTLRTALGCPVPGMLVHSVITHVNHALREVQIVQRSSGEVVVRAVPGQHGDRTAVERIAHIVATYLQDVPVSVQMVDAIEKGPGGKHQCIVIEKAPLQGEPPLDRRTACPAIG